MKKTANPAGRFVELTLDDLDFGEVVVQVHYSRWAGALDAVGGEMLAWLTRTMQQDGVIAGFGNAGGIKLHTTVMPFILRGVRLIGIDSAATAMPLRREIWRRLATDPLRLSSGQASTGLITSDLAGVVCR